ncbi:DUF262 domain-containing protein [Photobacterium damselae]|uniref:DUF262 domain-containing protein n=1 Tax=Photobacterium damselae TaxID=38293 RepID=UPI0011D0D7A8|nr:DUF262 domain-containing protein [Photobacterium damselae]KAB1516094.1 DUF262 domain-containing protein [Photobacterium damselae subsp. damselae]
MQKSLDIFKAEPQSVFDVICDKKNTGFYMPAYQRPYSWEEKHIQDLFADCENVFRNLLESSDAIIFLGSLLTVDDSAASTICPLAKRHTPTHIKLVIDGQQRLSTLVLIILCLNERLNTLLPKLKKAIDKEVDANLADSLEDLREIVSQLIQDTSNFVVETQAEHDLYKYLPKVIRSQVDCWGKDDKKANYTSPLSEALLHYQRHIINCKDKNSFKAMSLDNLSKRIVDNIKIIRKQLDDVQLGFQANKDETFLTVENLVDKETLDTCLDFPIDNSLLIASDKNTDIKSVIFITAFAKFLLHRVCLTYVEVNNESYAFDMFEALNTTGEPLTAIETFVPKVIEHIGYKRKHGDDDGADNAIKTLNGITERFEVITKTKDKNDKAKALILAFVRAYQGKVKITTLRDQRDAMIKSYDSCLYIDKDDYLNHLKATSDFLFDYWQAKTPDLTNFIGNHELEQANICLRYLTDLKHDIASSLLVQFILQDKKYNTLETSDSNFVKALKAITAFSVLWRTMSGGADGIDNVYKKLHEKGFKIGDSEFPPYQLQNNTSLSQEKFDIELVKSYFISELESKIITKDSPESTIEAKWLDICSKQPILTKTKNIKLLVLSAFHNLELNSEGFVRSDEKRNDFYTTSMWDLLSNNERISKVYASGLSDINSFADQKIIQPENFNKLGNVLVDARCNITNNKNQSWHSLRQKMLEAQNNESIDNIDKLLNSESMVSNETKKNASVLMFERKYAEITYFDEWTEQAINERTKLLLSNAWENLIDWLK